MMNLVKWNPWREMPALPNRLNRFFDDPFFRIGRMADDSELSMWNPAVEGQFIATLNEEGSLNFEDAAGTKQACRFYRVVVRP